ncbi:MAG: dicarboxylate/amino acid:cation symporter [Gammaproteobacteria bacterium]
MLERTSPRLPLYLQVIFAALFGTLCGVSFGTDTYLFGTLDNETLGQLGMLVIRLLKALATPLIFVAILDAFIQTDISFKHGGRLLAICSMNLMAAMAIGLTIMNVFHPGESWSGHLSAMMAQLPPSLANSPIKPAPANVSLNPLQNIAGYIPTSLAEPFVQNNIISIILLALLAGAALRQLSRHSPSDEPAGLQLLEKLVSGVYQLLIQMLLWVVRAIPFAVFGVVAQVVGRSGLAVFEVLAVFLVTLLAGLLLHALGYYPLMAKWGGKMPIKSYFAQGADAILMGLSTNSSLATVPVTLRCLTENMGISARSARLSACVGTNLNNDGIMLYEAMTALFLAQAVGFHLDFAQQLLIVAAAIMVGVGISGVPEAGLIALPLVLSSVGLPETLIITAIPLITTIDWIIARCRSGVNVMNDMLVAILLERWEKYSASAQDAGERNDDKPV